MDPEAVLALANVPAIALVAGEVRRKSERVLKAVQRMVQA